MGEEVHGALERRRSSLGGSGGRAKTRTDSSIGVTTPGAESKRSRTRTNSSLSTGTPRAGTKKQASFGFGSRKTPSREEMRGAIETFPSVREQEENAHHGKVEDVRGDANAEMVQTKKTPLTEEELAQVCIHGHSFQSVTEPV